MCDAAETPVRLGHITVVLWCTRRPWAGLCRREEFVQCELDDLVKEQHRTRERMGKEALHAAHGASWVLESFWRDETVPWTMSNPMLKSPLTCIGALRSHRSKT